MIFLARLFMLLCFFSAPAFFWVLARGVKSIAADFGPWASVGVVVACMPILFGLALLIDIREAQARPRQPGPPDPERR